MSELEKEFVPYQESLELKKLGFDEPCFGAYGAWGFMSSNDVNTLTDEVIQKDLDEKGYNEEDGVCLAPTFSQAFRFFREKHNLHAEPYTCDMGAIEYCFQIRDLYSEKYVYDNFRGVGSSYGGTFNTPEEAELVCLRKLIEIVKSQKICLK